MKLFTARCPECGCVTPNVPVTHKCSACGNPRVTFDEMEAIKELLRVGITPTLMSLTEKHGERFEECRIRTESFEISIFSSGEVFVRLRW